MAEINGNNRSNIIISGSSDDEINAGGGNDLVISGAGDDTINGGAGRDIIISGSGDDVIDGGSGNDIIISGSGDDTIDGGSGNDIIISGTGNDTIDGGSGHDLIISGSGDDIVDGGAGNDVINTGSGNDTVDGGSGHDVINTGSGDDTVTGNTGSDVILSGSGHDTVEGNEGHDVIITGTGNDVIDAGDGNDIVVSGAGDDTINAGAGHDVILSGDGNDTVNGGSGDDVIITGRGEDTINGGDGWDWIHAGADNDIIEGGAGNDYINGGSEFDIAVFSGNYADYTITQINDTCYTVTHNASGEVDTVVNVELFRFNDVDVDPANPTVNTDPTANDDTATVDEDSSVNINVLTNDTDADGDALSVTSATAANGSVVIEADGTLTYTPNADFNGTDTISYEIADGNGGTSTATVTVTVNAVNDGPVAADDSATTDEDTAVSIDVLSNDSDVDGDALSVTSATAANGTVVIETDGTLTYTPNADFNGTDTISYEIADGNGGTSTATVAVTVNTVNDGPVAADDSATTDEDTAVSIDVLSNDSDVDGDALSVTSASAANGSVVIEADGTLTYTPNADFNGTDTISYEIADGNGGASTATVSVTVNAVNDGPVAADDTATTDEDTSVSIDVLSNDSDVDGDALSVTSASAANGTVVIEADGTLTYTPNADFNGTDTISYEIADGNGGTSSATVSVTVNAVNDGPVAADDSATTDEDTSVSIDVLSNDSDADGDALTVTSASAANGTVVIEADGTLTYTPNADFNGTDTISYEIADGNGGTSTATVAVTVNAANDGPVATDDSATTDEDVAVSIDVLANDTDSDGDALSVTSATAAFGTVVIEADGTLTYTPNADFNGTDSISYEIADGNGGTSSATVSVTVNAVNDGPVAADDTATTDENVAITVDVLSNDSDIDGDALTVTSATAANGTVSINADGTLAYTPNTDFSGVDTISYEISDGQGGSSSASVYVTVSEVNLAPVANDDAATTQENTTVTVDVLANDTDADGDALTVTSASAANGTVVINADGTVDYTPNTDFVGSDSISYVISDGNGGISSAEVTVDVTPSNFDPVAVDDNIEVEAGTNGYIALNLLVSTFPLVIDDSRLTENDYDPDGDAISITHVNGVALSGGSVSGVTGSNGGTFTVNADGTATMDARSFDYLAEGETALTSIQYTISDGNGGTATATVYVTVNGLEEPNEIPVAVNDDVATDENTAVTIDVLANDTDADGDALTVSSASALNGTVTINTDGTLEYVPNTDFNGVDTISYSIDDGNGGTASAEVSVTVGTVNLAPTATDDDATLFHDETATIDVLANDTDPEGDTLTVTSASATNGMVSINPDGTIDYTANVGFFGADTIVYEISDGNGNTDTASVSITVYERVINEDPIAVDDYIEVEAGSNGYIAVNLLVSTWPLEFDDSRLTENDYDPDGDAISITHVNGDPLSGGSISGVVGTNGGIFTVNSDGTATMDARSFDLAEGESAITSIEYTISDGRGGSATATVEITVRGPNAAPDAIDDAASVGEAESVTVDLLANDIDPEGKALSVTSVDTTGLLGTLTDNGDGTFSYDTDGMFDYLEDGQTSEQSFSYTVTDSEGLTDTAMVYLTVVGSSAAPAAAASTSSSDPVDSGTEGTTDTDYM